jgi:nitroreductase
MTDRSPPPLAELCDALIHSRQHFSPKHLAAPGPDDAMLRQLLAAAAAAPDHRQLRPWRFLVLGPAARATLGQAFAQALRERDPEATETQQAEARDKALRGPVLLLAVVDLRAEAPEVAPMERVLSLGCALQNLMLAAQARGLASGLSSGRALSSAPLRQAFGLVEGEHALCFVSLGTPRRSQPRRPRPEVDEIARWV